MDMILKVDGMMCSHCAARIEKALADLGIPPKIDLENKTVTVNTEKSENEIISALSDIGYDAKVI